MCTTLGSCVFEKSIYVFILYVRELSPQMHVEISKQLAGISSLLSSRVQGIELRSEDLVATHISLLSHLISPYCLFYF